MALGPIHSIALIKLSPLKLGYWITPLTCDVTALHRTLEMRSLDINDEEHHRWALKASIISCVAGCEREWYLILRVSLKAWLSPPLRSERHASQRKIGLPLGHGRHFTGLDLESSTGAAVPSWASRKTVKARRQTLRDTAVSFP